MHNPKNTKGCELQTEPRILFLHPVSNAPSAVGVVVGLVNFVQSSRVHCTLGVLPGPFDLGECSPSPLGGPTGRGRDPAGLGWRGKLYAATTPMGHLLHETVPWVPPGPTGMAKTHPAGETTRRSLGGEAPVFHRAATPDTLNLNPPPLLCKIPGQETAAPGIETKPGSTKLLSKKQPRNDTKKKTKPDPRNPKLKKTGRLGPRWGPHVGVRAREKRSRPPKQPTESFSPGSPPAGQQAPITRAHLSWGILLPSSPSSKLKAKHSFVPNLDDYRQFL
ncbi:hypothetical protein GWK47_046656 [Chionoecetes opilio]|uniref:Uncharacterized protein n=1 Tax=Chionoecetes opilio TaxID=41210 RepID=A0A8J4Y692_CHIOP|nr:hypothetical protein GWK47_046656 [Chionoecetes opilio]